MPSPPSPHGIYETGSIDKERQARPSCSTSESKHFLASRDLYSTLHALREKRRSSPFEKHRSYCDSIALPRENFKTKRVGHVETRTRSRRKKENEKKFSTLHVRVYTYVRDLGSEYGANKGNWTRIFNSAKEVASFVLRLGRGLFPALLLQGRLTWNSPPPLSSSPIKYLSSKSIVAFGIRFKNLRALNIPIFFFSKNVLLLIFLYLSYLKID